jgi:serine/threonine-protein kinase
MVLPPQIGPYTILGELGRGGMGVVYRARRGELEREFALKVILAGAGASAEMVQRFRREAQAAAALAGEPGIVGVHDIGRAEDGSVYFAMDLVEGQSLEDVLAEGEAVGRAHARGILHRDLKPANIMVTPDGRALVTDFGLAKLEAADPELTRLTQSGEVLGTPAYMAPEQAKGEHCTPAADVYALGATLYEALSGRPPFTGDSIHAVMAQVLTQEPPPLRRVNPQVPRPLEGIVHQCLEKAPGSRYPDAEALAADLDRYLAGDVVTALERTAGRAVGRAVRRSWAPVAVGGAVVAALAGGVAWWAATREEVADADRSTAAVASERRHADRATQITGAWHALSARTGPAMQALDDHWVGRVPAIDTATALAAVRETVAAVRAEFPDTRLPEAWEAAAGVLAGDDAAWDALEAVRAGSGDDPTPHLLAMRVAWANYARDVEPIRTVYDGRRIRPQRFAETEAQGVWRERAAQALVIAKQTGLWDRLQGIDAARAFGAAAGHLAEGAPAAAAAGFAALGDEPQFGATAQLLAGTAWFQVADNAAAAEVWERLHPRRWAAPVLSAASARTGLGQIAMAAGNETAVEFERALAGADAVLQWQPELAVAHQTRAVVCMAWAMGLNQLDRPVPQLRARLEEGLRSFDAALQRTPGEADLLVQRGRAHHLRGLLAQRVEADPLPDFRRALADAATVQQDEPGEWRSLAMRGQVHSDAAAWTRSRDPAAAIRYADRAAADLAAVLEARPDATYERHERGAALRVRAQLAQAAGQDPLPFFQEALAEFGKACVPEPPPGIHPYLARGHLALLLAQALMDRRRDPRVHLRTAVQDLSTALKLEPGLPDALEHLAAARGMVAVVEAAQRNPKAGELFRAAMAAFAQALEANPGHRNLWFNRIQIIAQYALYEQRAGRNAGGAWAQAAEAAELFAAKSPGDGEAQLLCAQLCWQVGKRNEALAALERAEALAATNPRLMGPVKALRRRMQGGR